MLASSETVAALMCTMALGTASASGMAAPALALVHPRPEGTGRGGTGNVRAGQHDHGAVAAELEVDPFQVGRAQLADPPTPPRGAGERDHPHLRCRDDGLACVGSPDEQAEHARGQPRLLGHRCSGPCSCSA